MKHNPTSISDAGAGAKEPRAEARGRRDADDRPIADTPWLRHIIAKLHPAQDAPYVPNYVKELTPSDMLAIANLWGAIAGSSLLHLPPERHADHKAAISQCAPDAIAMMVGAVQLARQLAELQHAGEVRQCDACGEIKPDDQFNSLWEDAAICDACDADMRDDADPAEDSE